MNLEFIKLLGCCRYELLLNLGIEESGFELRMLGLIMDYGLLLEFTFSSEQPPPPRRDPFSPARMEELCFSPNDLLEF
jgi:hypothetical protein